MSRFGFLFIHFIPSLANWPRMLFSSPWFALRLLWQRTFFFVMRKLPYTLIDPSGFLIDTPEVLNSYWSIFAERALTSEKWLGELMKTTNPVVLDIGANAGVFSHLIRKQKPDTTIYAFEPLPVMADRIRHWSETFDHFTLYEGACSSTTGTATFYIRSENDTTATLETGNAAERIRLDVKTYTVDEVIPKQDIFMMKIDVEGHEPSVLQGAQQTLQSTRFLIMEAHTTKQKKTLEKILGDKWSSQKIAPTDWLFINQQIYS